MKRLEHKLIIKGKITAETGLHIGGSEVELDIGGIDNEVIKVRRGKDKIPYIPGSSLKGKLRALIARYHGFEKPESDKGTTASLFGIAPKGNKKMVVSQLIVRDSYFENNIYDTDGITDADKITEDKAENTIVRLTGKATPRHMERVTAGAVFELDMVLDIYKNDNETALLQTLDLGFQLLKRDYLGGSGTRGNGKVNISNLGIKKIMFEQNGEIKSEDHDFKFQVND